MDTDKIMDLTAQIVTSAVAKKEMGKDEIIAMIREVSVELKAIDNPPIIEPVVETPAPPKNPLKSIKKDEVVCLICGEGGFKTLTRHLRNKHNLEPKDYKKQFGIPAKISLTAKEYAEKRSAVAKANNLGEKLQAGRKAAKAEKEAKASKKKPEIVQVPAE